MKKTPADLPASGSDDVSTLARRLSEDRPLPVAPGVALEILRWSDREHAEIRELAEIVSRDPVIASKLLRTANSSALGRPGTVTSFHEAVMSLGTRRVNMLALSFSLTSTSTHPANRAFDYTLFWTTSAVHTVAARRLAGLFAERLVDEAFVAGLLCDLGQLVLAESAPALYAPVLRARRRDHRPVDVIERELLGETHAELARDLFARWGLPALLCDAVGAHHDPGSLDEGDEPLRILARLLHVATACGELFARGRDEELDEVIRLGRLYFDMDPESGRALFQHLREDVEEFLAILDPRHVDPAEADRLRARAGERLLEQNLDLEQRFESLSRELARLSLRNAELESRANLDPVTKLQTRGHFEDLASKHLEAAAISRTSIGLLMMDVDRFKQINDRFGHVCGDAVLAGVGAALVEALPPSCVIARWGGDEFAALCPGVDTEQLLDLAETLLERIADVPAPGDSRPIHPTLSIGGVVLERPDSGAGFGQMIRQADVELYRAKDGGRNRACITEFKHPES